MEAFEVAAENVPGVKKVDDRLMWVDTITGDGVYADNHMPKHQAFD